jgi:two-component system, LytTR family, sensor kinase
MFRKNCKIGFDDRLVTIIMVPLLAFLIPIVFFGRRIGRAPHLNWRVYVTTFITTAVIWIGSRIIMSWARNKYPLFSQQRKRLIIQSFITLALALVATNVIGFLLNDFCRFQLSESDNLNKIDVIINSNAAAIFCSITVSAIYESIYFMQQLRTSIEEKELLKRESLSAQLNALRTQVNPHFLFNNLNTLCSLIPENPSHAVNFVQELSKVYRHILEVKNEKTISLQDELDVLNAYTFLLKTRFDKNLSIDVDIPSTKMNLKIVPLSLQILMENAIKHNIVSEEKPLSIKLFAENGNLVITNNLQIKNQINESTGIGLENIRNRYKLISEKKVIVTESKNSFTVSIPLIEN